MGYSSLLHGSGAMRTAWPAAGIKPITSIADAVFSESIQTVLDNGRRAIVKPIGSGVTNETSVEVDASAVSTGAPEGSTSPAASSTSPEASVPETLETLASLRYNQLLERLAHPTSKSASNSSSRRSTEAGAEATTCSCTRFGKRSRTCPVRASTLNSRRCDGRVSSRSTRPTAATKDSRPNSWRPASSKQAMFSFTLPGGPTDE